MSDEKVDMNQAGIPELSSLPGIGEKLAEKIVKYREKEQPFSEIADLAAVPGISDQMVSELEDHLTVQLVEEESVAELEESEEEKEKAEKAVSIKTPQSESESSESEQPLQELRAAARNGEIKRVKALIKDGADGCDKFALIWAAQDGHSQVVTELLRAGADVNSKTAADGTNALDLAVQNGHLEVVQTLIQVGANVDEPAIGGWTPLMKAAYFGHYGIAQILVESGAKTQTRDAHGKTATDHARQSGNSQITGLFIH